EAQQLEAGQQRGDQQGQPGAQPRARGEHDGEAHRRHPGEQLPEIHHGTVPELKWPRHTLVTVTVAPFRAWRGSRANVGRAMRARLTPHMITRRSAWRRRRDSNPRYHHWHTRFPIVHLRPLGHLSKGHDRDRTHRLALQRIARVVARAPVRQRAWRRARDSNPWYHHWHS